AAPMENYLSLHRHSLAQAALIEQPGVALRLLTACLVIGSSNVRAKADPRRAMRAEIAASAEASPAAQAVAAERAAVSELLDIPFEADAIAGGDGDAYALCQTFRRLLMLGDDEVRRILAYLAAETLDCGGAVVEALGTLLAIDPASRWSADAAFLDL